ncbi:MAG: acetyl-CoA hydrolase/transferase C-terminal domain-containing protein [Steroidobacteraceae bacterium]
MPEHFDRADLVIDEVLRRVGRRLVVGMPIGIGKPIALVNELYRRAAGDPAIDLTFLTGLTLTRPRARSPLEHRFLDPFVERVFGDDPEPAYVEALRSNTLPPNIRVSEFFFTPGSALDWPTSQQQHLADNFTEVTRALLARGINVVLQLVASRRQDGQRQFSLGSNPDVAAELVPEMRRRATAQAPIAIVGQVHPDMPFMLGDACVEPGTFDLLLEHPRYDYRLYGPPNLPLSDIDHAIGLHVSSLLADGGTLQIGIGEFGDAVCYATLLRHQRNEDWQRAVAALASPATRALSQSIGGSAPFVTGLFGCSEMFLDQLLDLARAGILRREVYDCLPIERALASGALGERFDADVLERLLDHGLDPHLDAASFALLQRCGVLHSSARYEAGCIVREDGRRIEADLSRAEVRRDLAATLGRRLKGGAVLHAAFLLGPQSFYAALRELPESERARFLMNTVGRVNRLGEAQRELHRLQRRGARFINTTMMVTLLGAAVSDGLEDGRVVSGVGGQMDFILQARELPDARSILCLRATREKDGLVQSNLRMAYGYTTVPRHLRDIVVTEYGAADLRDRTDAEVIAALLEIADSRFQPQLLAEAQRAGKVARSYRIPDHARHNTPQRLAGLMRPLRARGQFSEYPFGTDFSKEEIALARALPRLAAAAATPMGRAALLWRAAVHRRGGRFAAELARMDLDAPRSWRERLDRRLVSWALAGG